MIIFLHITSRLIEQSKRMPAGKHQLGLEIKCNNSFEAFFIVLLTLRQKKTSFIFFSGVTKDEIGPLRTVVSGGIAGTTLWTLIFPADVIKSRQQVGFKSHCG